MLTAPSSSDSDNIIPFEPQPNVVDDHRPAPAPGFSLHDFRAYLPRHSYIYTATREMWPAASVNAMLPPMPGIGADGKPVMIAASKWLDQNLHVEQMTWAPGMDMIIEGNLVIRWRLDRARGRELFQSLFAADARARRPEQG